MKKTYTRIRGTSDFSSPQACLLNTIARESRNVFALYGYEELNLPLLEDEGVFVRGVGAVTDIVERQLFRIEGKDIVLRPEGTAQVVRYYLENSLYKKSDFYKFFYMGPMFRGERPQKGRLRQFHHIGAEAIGSNSPHLDVEVIALSLQVLDTVGITERKLLLNTLGCTQDKERFSAQLSEALAEHRSDLCDDCRRRLDKNPLRVLDCKHATCKKLVVSLALGKEHLCPECSTHFKDVLALLDQLGIQYTYSPHLVRGLDYYTNTVFEITSPSLGSQDAIGAGGRYNNLIAALGGPHIPAIGFALGVERILIALGEQPPHIPQTVLVVTAGEGLRSVAFEVVAQLRRAGVGADTNYTGKSLKGQLRVAQKKGVRFVVLIGQEEWHAKEVMLKDMQAGTQEKVSVDILLMQLSTQRQS